MKIKNKNILKNPSGITIVALVVTIIVLIILAGVSINLIIGDNGLIKKAKEAKNQYEKATELEEIKLAAASVIISGYEGNDTPTIDRIIQKLDTEKIGEVKTTGDVSIIEYGDNTYKIDLNNGKVEENNIEYDNWDGVSKSTGLVGEGTIQSPYLIRSANDLKYLADTMSSESTITGLNEDETQNNCDLYANIAEYKLVTNISLENKNWEPIGYKDTTYSKVFVGTFDGNGYEITKMKINKPESNFIGLFAYGNECTIKNLILTQVDITGNDQVGTIIGKTSKIGSQEMNILNCYCSGKVTSNNMYVGGIIGEAFGGSTISNCQTNMEITGVTYVGGIAGRVTNDVKINNCYSRGTINAKQRVGGIAGGTQEGKIYKSNNSANIFIIEEEGHESNQMGGLVGELFNTDIESCSNSGKITVTNDSGEIGGLIGDAKISRTGVYLKKSYSTGDIEATNVKYNYGKLIGFLGGAETYEYEITECYNSGNVSAQNDIGKQRN